MGSFEIKLEDYSIDGYFDYSNSSEEPGELASPCTHWALGPSSVVLVIIYSTVFAFSMLGNSLVIYVVHSMKSCRTTTDVYLMNLALADLLFSLTLPFWAVYTHDQWVFGNLMCKLLSGLQEATFYSGILMLACISVDRYLAIVKATQVIPMKRHLVGAVSGGVWLSAVLLSLPVVFQREAFRAENAARMVCHENMTAESVERWRVGVRVLHHTVGFFIPLAVMLVCYGLTVGTLLRARSGQKHKAMRVILSVVLAFLACWLPHNITMLVDTLMRGELLEETCRFRSQVDLALQVTQVLAFLHCAVNPVLYAFIGQKFRNQLLTSLFKHGLISQRNLFAYRTGSVQSQSSRHTSVTL
ncbi:C-X-C chemokine receptor type 2-like [Megalops cyprinoides]|uniref:C-X-C chemokine receptor type 2-like n=1 Tax=Megalops cyprinoides TaxID=118141 RepID=UPI00186492A6|nr:C-X-C chemokine receptor type 2-like [Megalops cyprinoides]